MPGKGKKRPAATKRPGRGPNVYGAMRSLPGEPPRKQEGDLRRSIAWVVDRSTMTALVGTSLIKGRYLEMGTRRMAARPFLRSTLNKNADKYLAIMFAAMKRK